MLAGCYHRCMTKTSNSVLACDDLQPSITRIGTNRLPCVGLILVKLQMQFRSSGRSSRASLVTSSNPLRLMKPKSFFAAAALFVSSFLPFANAATHTWTGASGDGKWSTAANWSGGAPTAGEAASVVLVFPAAGSKNTQNDIANLTVDQIQITGDNYVISATGAATNLTLRSQVFGSTFFINGANAVITNFNFNLSTSVVTHASIAISTGDTTTFRSRFTGPGGLIKRAAGTMVMRGGAANNYTGTTRIEGGLLQLNHPSNAVPGDLIIADPGIGMAAEVENMFQHQIADGASILVNSNGTFTPGVFSEAINSITLSNANLVAGIGLTLNGAFRSIGSNTVTGVIRMGSAQSEFHVTGHLTLDAFLQDASGSAGPLKTGSGKLELKRANTFTGTTLVNQGMLVVNHSTALGSTGNGTAVANYAMLEIAPGISVTNEALEVTGAGEFDVAAFILQHNSSWHGTVLTPSEAWILVPVGSQAAIAGELTGSRFIKSGYGQLRLGGTTQNNMDELTVLAGKVQLAKPAGIHAVTGELNVGTESDNPNTAIVQLLANHQIANNTPVFVNATGQLDLNGFSDGIGSLRLHRGRVETDAGTLTLGGNVTITGNPFGYQDNDCQIIGTLSLGGATRTIETALNSQLVITGNIIDGGAAAGITKAGSGYLRFIGGTNTYSGLTTVNAGAFVLQDNGRPGATTAGTVVNYPGQLLLVRAAVGAEALTLNNGDGSMLFFVGTNSWAGPVNISGKASLYAYYATDLLTLSGPLGGTGIAHQKYAGRIQLAGTADNTISGGIMLEDIALMELNKTGGAVAVPCPLTIGLITNKQDVAIVRLLGNNQIANDAPVIVNRTGLLDLNGFSDSIGDLTIAAGKVETGAGTITLLGDLYARGPNYSGTFNGNWSLGSATRNIIGIDSGGLNLNAVISDVSGTAGLNVKSNVTIYLGGYNTYGGITTVANGYLYVKTATALGSAAAGTVVQPGGTLALGGYVDVVGESLILSGDGNGEIITAALMSSHTNSWSGPVLVLGDASIGVSNPYLSAAQLTIGGIIEGTGTLTKKHNGTLILSGPAANHFSGTTLVEDGTLLLNKTPGNAIAGGLTVDGAEAFVKLLSPNQIVNLASVNVLQGTLDLNGFSEVIGSLSGSGTVKLGNGLTSGGNNSSTTFAGVIEGSGDFTKAGTGTLLLCGTNTYTGKTLVQNGRLNIDGYQPQSAVELNGGILGGRGTAGAISGGSLYVAPGHAAETNRFGALKSSGLNLNSSAQARFDIGGTQAGVDHDQLHVKSGVLILNNVMLQVNPMFDGAVSNQYVIIRSDAGAAMGTFAGLPEGATVNAGNLQFRISYSGGDGNDVVLTQLNATAPQIAGIQPMPNGQMQISGSGNALANYQVEANAELSTTNWVNVGTVQADANGTISFTDPNAGSFIQRFYRFKVQ